MKYILGTKQEMTQIFTERGEVIPVTVVKAGPCVVTQVRTIEKDGYQGVQLAYGSRNKVNKAMAGHTGKFGKFKYIKEFRDETDVKVGDKISTSTFEVGDIVRVTGTSKGRGFQGVVKRHGFAGAKASHGTKDQLRMPGSIGATGPAHVFKGQRMPGQMGAVQRTTTGLEVVQIDSDNNLLYIKGSIPGARNCLVWLRGVGDLKVSIEAEKVEKTVEEKKPEVEEPKVTKPEVKKEEVAKEPDVKKEELKEKSSEAKASEEKSEEKIEESKQA